MIVQMLFNPAQQLLQQRMFGAFEAGLAAAPSTSLRPDWSLEQRQLSSPCTFFCMCPPLCPSFKTKDLSYFGCSSSFSRVAFMLTSEKAQKDCHSEPSESTELMTNVT